MTSKEKAIELVSTHYSLISGMELSYISKLIEFPSGDSHYETAKQCALIAVDEIIKVFNTYESLYISEIEIPFWQEVKSEIDKL